MATKFRENGGLCPRKRPYEDPLLQRRMISYRSQEAANCSNSGRIRRNNEPTELSLDLELTGRIRKIGAGLQNLGNTCFLNSVLQCLTYTEPLAAYLQSGRHKKICRASGFCAMCAIQNHVMNALASSGKILAPSHLVKNLRCISRNFRISRQEDAHEYMVNLMESMHRCCLPSGIASESPSAYEKSLVHKIFGGRLRNQVKCTQCSYGSNKYDPFLDLSLQIVQADSLLKALSQYFAEEQLDGGEKVYQCVQCKVKVQALIQLTVDKAPNILAIHLKRFNPGGYGGKINKKVEFVPALDMKPFVSGPHEGDLKYTLYGVLVHAGSSSNSGHYYCFIRTSSGIWYALDDNRVYQVSEKSVLDQKAYMLFYVRNRRATNQPLFKREHQGSELKNNKEKSANVVFGKESQSLASSAGSILKGSLCLNSDNAAVSEAKDLVPRKETLLDGNSSLEVAEARHKTRLSSSAGEQPVSIGSLSKLPSTWNSDGMKNGSMATQVAASNGLQGVAPMNNVNMLDPGADNEHRIAKDSVGSTDNGHKTSVHLTNSVSSGGQKIVEHLENGDTMNHEHGKGYSLAKEMPDCKIINQGAANVHQVDEALMDVHTNMSIHGTDLRNNDTDVSSLGNVSVIAQNPGNGNSLLSKDHAILKVSSKMIEPGSLSNLTEEHSCLLQKQDSNTLFHSKKVKLWKQYLRLLRIIPWARGHLLLSALKVSRRKSSLKRKKRYLLKSKASSQSKSMNLLKHDKIFLTSQCTLVPKRHKKTIVVAGETPVVGNKPGINVANNMSNGKYCLDSCQDVENHGLKALPIQNGRVCVKAEESNFQSRLHLGFGQCSYRQICTQDGLFEAEELKENIEERCSGTVAEVSGTMCLKHNGNDLGLCPGTNKKEFSSVLHTLQSGDASASIVGIHDRRSLDSHYLNGTSSKFLKVSAQDRPRVAQTHFTSLEAGLHEATGISKLMRLEADGEEIDIATDEKKVSDGYVLEGWVKEHESGRRKKVKTSPSENGMVYGDKRHYNKCKNPFQVISSGKHKIKNKQSRGRHSATRNEPARI